MCSRISSPVAPRVVPVTPDHAADEQPTVESPGSSDPAPPIGNDKSAGQLTATQPSSRAVQQPHGSSAQAPADSTQQEDSGPSAEIDVAETDHHRESATVGGKESPISLRIAGPNRPVRSLPNPKTTRKRTAPKYTMASVEKSHVERRQPSDLNFSVFGGNWVSDPPNP